MPAEQPLREKRFPIKGVRPDDCPPLVHELAIQQIDPAGQDMQMVETRLLLEESRTRCVELYDHAPVGYFTFDREGRIVEANLTASRQLGKEKVALLNQPFSSFLTQADGDLFTLHLKKVFTTGIKQTCALPLRLENGNPCYVQLTSTLSAKLPNDTPHCRTTAIEINDRKTLEETLKVSSTLYRSLFTAARDGLLLLDAGTGQISDANPFFMEMLDYTDEDLIGKRLWEIGLFQGIEASQVTFCDLQSKGCVRFAPPPIKTRSGRLVAVESINSVCLADRYAVIQCNLREVTSQEGAAAKAARAYDGTERRLRERRSGSPSQAGPGGEALTTAESKSLQSALAEIKTLKNRLVTENISFHQEVKEKEHFGHIIGQSDGLKYVLYRAEQVAPTNSTVLILGETGTGKELIAAAIHTQSPRKDRPLITVNCAALPANLLESELFGREKGAFTGADTRQIGRFELAHGSTLCLDEIGEIPLEMQAKLLRVIQHNEFERLGSSKTIKVDVRIVATTNRNFEEAIRAGQFRQDLYYRLNVFPITIPPLRQRTDDIPLMVESFVQRYGRMLGKQFTSIPKETMQALLDYPWPGNVRELENIIERAVILCPGPVFQLMDKLHLSSPSLSSTVGTMEEMERNQIAKALTETNWRIEGKHGAAVILGLHPSTLRAKMHKLGIARPLVNSKE